MYLFISSDARVMLLGGMLKKIMNETESSIIATSLSQQSNSLCSPCVSSYYKSDELATIIIGLV